MKNPKQQKHTTAIAIYMKEIQRLAWWCHGHQGPRLLPPVYSSTLSILFPSSLSPRDLKWLQMLLPLHLCSRKREGSKSKEVLPPLESHSQQLLLVSQWPELNHTATREAGESSPIAGHMIAFSDQVLLVRNKERRGVGW